MTIRTSARLLALSATLLMAAPAFARTRTVTPAVKVNYADITSFEYGVRRMYVPGKWTVGTAAGSGVTLTKGVTSLTLQIIPKDDCGYLVIRKAAQKAWNEKSLDQSKARIQTLVLGRSSYGGFSWILPKKEYHWCLKEDAKNATEVSIMNPDKDLLNFLSTNFVRQLAVRSAIR